MSRRTVGVGTDIVTVDRITDLVGSGGDRFLSRWFTQSEIEYCNSKSRPELHLAARLAAKEAVVKALRHKWDHIPWRDIDVGHTDQGAPEVMLSGDVLRHADSLGVDEIHLSISHCDLYATATALTVVRSGSHEMRPSSRPETRDQSCALLDEAATSEQAPPRESK